MDKAVLSRLLASTAAIAWLSSHAPGHAQSPQAPTVAAGSIAVTRQGATTVITQSTTRGIIDWRSFSIGAQEAVRFDQPGRSSVTVNRVTGAEQSRIDGNLSATGQVWIANPNGVMIGPGGQVNVGGLLATTGRVDAAEFLNSGRAAIDQIGRDAAIVSQGTINIAAGGYAALAAASIRNEGVISARAGSVALGAGKAMTVDFAGDKLITFQVTQPLDQATPGDAMIAAGGKIAAEGGTVLMSARAAKGVMDNVINLTGHVVANSVKVDGGTVSFGDGGVVQVSGRIDAGNAAGKGGDVAILGEKVGLMDGAVIDASGATGGGAVLIGGDWQGKGTVQNASVAYVAPTASINVDATVAGDGGKAVVWADDTTRFNGTISARGGAMAGNGGRVETSGKRTLDVGDAAVVTTAPLATAGKAGSWLLDPNDITISTAADSGVTIGSPFQARSSSGNSTLNVSTIAAALSTGDVTIQTSAGSGGSGFITFASGSITANVATARTLTLLADNDITFNAGARIALTGAAHNVTLQSAATAKFQNLLNGNVVIAGATITTTGGTIQIGGGVNGALASQSSATAHGVEISAASVLDAGTGVISMAGATKATVAGTHGVFISGGSKLSAETLISIKGYGNSGPSQSGNGVLIDGSTLIGGRAITLEGDRRQGKGDNIGLQNGATLQALGGVVTLNGVSTTGATGNGVYITNSQILVGAGQINLTGAGALASTATNSSGVQIDTGGALKAIGAGGIKIDGARGFGYGAKNVFLSGAALQVVDGSIILSGTSSGGGDSSIYGQGVAIESGSTIQSKTGTISISGAGPASGPASLGVQIAFGGGTISSEIGSVLISAGASTIAGMNLAQGAITTGGDIELRARSITTSGMTLTSTGGVVRLRPLIDADSIGVFGGAGTTQISASVLNALSASSTVEIGSGTQTGDITVATAAYLSRSSSFRTGSGAINFLGAVDATTAGGQALKASTSAGTVTFSGAVGANYAFSTIDVQGPSVFRGGWPVVSVGTQRYGGAVVVGAQGSFTTTNSNIYFGATADGVGGLGTMAFNLGSGTASFAGAVGATTSAFGNLTFGNAAFGGDVVTTGQQSYTGAVALNAANITLTSKNSGVLIGAGANLTYAGGSKGSLTIRAGGDISVSNASILSTGGPLDLTLNASAGATSPADVAGAITLSYATISGAGSVTMGAGVGAALAARSAYSPYGGIYISNSSIAGSGSLTLSGAGRTACCAATSDGVLVEYGTLAMGGAVVIDGLGGVASNNVSSTVNEANGVVIAQSNIASGGALTITATGGSVSVGGSSNSSYGLQVNGSSLSSAGVMKITGTGGSVANGTAGYVTGILIIGGALSVSGAGGMAMSGTTGTLGVVGAGSGSAYGVGIYTSKITAGSGGVAITGTSGSIVSATAAVSYGVSLTSTTVDATNAASVAITGTGTGGGASSYGVGIVDSTLSLGAATLNVTGTAGAGTSANNMGVVVTGTSAVTGAGSMSFAGTGGSGAGDGFDLISGLISVAGSGALSITGARGTGDNSRNVAISGTLQTAGGDLSISGLSIAGGGKSSFGVQVASGALVATVDGKVNIQGAGATQGAGDSDGVILSGAVKASGTGAISVTGARGADLAALGGSENVNVGGSALIQTKSGSISLDGSSDAGAGNIAVGGLFAAGSRVISESGNISIVGTGAAAGGGGSHGVSMNGTVSAGGAGTINVTGVRGAGAGSSNIIVGSLAALSTGDGAITLTGTATAGGAPNNNRGVWIQGTIATANGAIAILGNGGASGLSNDGVGLDGAITASGTGSVLIRGQAGNLSSAGFAANNRPANRIVTNSGDVTIQTDNFYWASMPAGSILSTSGTVNIQSLDAGKSIGLDVPSSNLTVSSGFLNTIDGKVAIGRSDLTASIKIAANTVLKNPTTFRSGSGGVSFLGAVDGVAIGGASLTVSAGGMTSFAGSVGGSTAFASIDVSGPASFNAATVKSTGTQSYGGAVALTSGTTSFATADAQFSFGSRVDGPGALSVNTGTGVYGYVGPIGGTTALAQMSINGALTLGGTVHTTGGQSYTGLVTLNAVNTLLETESGDIAILSGGKLSYSKSAAGSLTLRAARDIIIDGGQIVSTGGKLDVTLNASAAAATAADVAGNIYLSNATISGAGSVTMGAGAGAALAARRAGAGVSVSRSSILGSGDFTLLGAGQTAAGVTYSQGVLISASTLTAGGAVAIDGTGGFASLSSVSFNIAAGVMIDASNVKSGGALAITARGGTASASGATNYADGLMATNSVLAAGAALKIAATGGAASASSGTNYAFGVEIGSSSLTSGAAGMTIAGVGGSVANGTEGYAGGLSVGSGTFGVTGAGSMSFSGTGGTLSVAGGGNGSIDAIVLSASKVTAGSGGVTITGVPGAILGAPKGTGNGVVISSTTFDAASAGSVQITGTGAAGGNFGVGVSINGSTLTLGASSLQVTGTAADGTGPLNAGFFVNGTSSITGSGSMSITGIGALGGDPGAGFYLSEGLISVSGSGALSITGARGAGAGARNILIAADGTVQTAGGALTLNGAATSGGSGNYNQGVEIIGRVSTVTGAISIIGAGSASGDGVAVGGVVEATGAGGSINVIGVGSAWTDLALSGALSATTGDITIQANVFNPSTASKITSGSGTIRLRSRDAANSIGVGGAPGDMALSSAFLNTVNGALEIGSASQSGAITIAANTVLNNATTFRTGSGAVNFLGAVDASSAGAALRVNAGGTTSFAGSVGGSTAFSTIDVSGPATFGAVTVKSAGTQSYGGAVVLTGGATSFSTTNAAFKFGSTVDGPGSLTVSTGTGTYGAVGPIGGVTALSAISINGALTLGGTVHTTGAQSYTGAVTFGATDTLLETETGDIAILSGGKLNYGKSAAGSLTLRAARDIVIDGGQILSSGGALNVTLDSGALATTQADVKGGVVIRAGTISTAGGSLVIGGGRNAALAASGSDALTDLGLNVRNGVILVGGSSVNLGAGAFTAKGIATSSAFYGQGVELTNSTVTATGGVRLTGTGSDASTKQSYGVLIEGNVKINAGDAGIAIDGTGGVKSAADARGVAITDSSLSYGAGALTITGHGGTASLSPGNHGVALLGTNSVTGSGAISITGVRGGGDGSANVYLNSPLSVGSGGMTIDGSSTAGGGAAGQNYGVAIGGAISLGGGTVSITGKGATQGANSDGVAFLGAGARVAALGGAGAIFLSGEASNATSAGLSSSAAAAGMLSTASGDITIQANTTSWNGAAAGAIKSSTGAVRLQSFGADKSVGVGGAGASSDYSTAFIESIGSKIEVGRSDLTADLMVAGGFVLKNDITFRTDSGAIKFLGAVDPGTTQSLKTQTNTGVVNFNGAVGGNTPFSTINIVGPVRFAAASVNTTGTQSYGAAAQFSDGVTTFQTTNANVTFGGPADGPGGASFALGSGTVRLMGGAGASSPLASLSTLNQLAVQGTVATTGAQSYGGSVTLLGDASFLASTQSIAFDRDIAGPYGVAVSAGAIRLGSTGLFSATTSNGGGQRYSGAVTLGSDVVLSSSGALAISGSIDGAQNLKASGASVTLDGVIGGTAPLASLTASAAAGPVVLSGTIKSSGSQSFGGAVALSGDTALSSSGGNIDFSAGISSSASKALSVSVDGAQATIGFGGAIGASGPLGDVSFTTGGAGILLPSITSANLTVTAKRAAPSPAPKAAGPTAAGPLGRAAGFASPSTDASVSQSAGAILIISGQLVIVADGAIYLPTTSNDFGTVKLTTAGSATLADANGFTLGRSSVGDLLSVTANGTVAQSGALTAPKLLLQGGAAVFSLNDASNAIGAFAAKLGGGEIEVTNGSGSTFTVGGVSGYAGISGVSKLSINQSASGGALVLAETINLGSGTAKLASAGVINGGATITGVGGVLSLSAGAPGSSIALQSGNTFKVIEGMIGVNGVIYSATGRIDNPTPPSSTVASVATIAPVIPLPPAVSSASVSSTASAPSSPAVPMIPTKPVLADTKITVLVLEGSTLSKFIDQILAAIASAAQSAAASAVAAASSSAVEAGSSAMRSTGGGGASTSGENGQKSAEREVSAQSIAESVSATAPGALIPPSPSSVGGTGAPLISTPTIKVSGEDTGGVGGQVIARIGGEEGVGDIRRNSGGGSVSIIPGLASQAPKKQVVRPEPPLAQQPSTVNEETFLD